jgi:transposase
MDVLLPVVLSVCCGIDVHQKTLTACLLKMGASGEAHQQSRGFRTVTGALQELAAWLVQEGCRHVAIESTGVYWKPVFNVLEKAGLEVVLVNAQHVKNVPGRKTDVKDAEWLATLLRVGLLRSSFVPPQEIRELRDLARYRTQVIRQRAQDCLPFAQALALLDQIPGVNQRIAQVLVAEIGLDMSRFKSDAQLAAWAGMCPGDHESGGKQKRGETRQGNGWLRQALVEAAWAASHTKDTSLRATFQRIKRRRGGKRACLAVGHRILRIAYALLSRPRPYEEEGFDYCRVPDKERVKDKLVRRLQKLGYAVTVSVAEAAA